MIMLLLFTICPGWASDLNQVKLLAFSGSTRADSYNKKALMQLIEAVKKEGVTVTYIDLADFTMPIYNGDLEEQKGLPENAKKFQNLLATHDGYLIATPEYNGFPSPLLINALDWASREEKGNANSGTKIFNGKFASLIAASPGKGGGSRGLAQLSQFLKNIGVKVLPKQTTIPNAPQMFSQIDNRQITTQAKSIVEEIKSKKPEGSKVAAISLDPQPSQRTKPIEN